MKVCAQIKSISNGTLLKVPVDKVLGLSCDAIEWCFQTLRTSTQKSIVAFSRQQIERFQLHFPLAGLVFCGILSAVLWQQSQKNDISPSITNITSVPNITKNITISRIANELPVIKSEAAKNKSDLSLRIAGVPLSTNDLISRLKEHDLWDLSGKTEITPLLLPGFPVNLQYLDVQSKKKAFFHTMLPVAKIALHEVEEERRQLLDIAQKIPAEAKSLPGKFKDGFSLYLLEKDSLFLAQMARKYRAAAMDELLAKVDVFPVSLILAQGAIESSWGTSRFATQGNNIFGVWTWGEKGMIPAERQEGKTHKVAIYDSILDSVRDYILTLNRHEAYEEIRNIRLQSDDSLQFAEGLKNYSERRDAYVSEVQMMIDFNRLQRYDSLNLAGDPGQWLGAS